MKRRLPWIVFGLLLGMTGACFYLRNPAPVPGPATPSRAEVPIEDGKTIDFSGGRAEVRDTPEDRAALERAKREMEEAARDVKFAPTKTGPKSR